MPFGGEKPMALASRLNSAWRTRRSSAKEGCRMSGAARMESLMPACGKPVLDAFGGARPWRRDIDVAEIELHGAGVDGGEVEDVVDDREQRVG